MTIDKTLPRTTEQLSESLMQRYAELIHRRTGIRMTQQKRTLLSNRLRRRLRATSIPSFDSYFDHITTISQNDPEWDAFIQEVTTHETYLFRDEAQWEWLRQEYVPSCRSRGQRKIRVWSAACSTGDECYTIACCLESGFSDSSESIKILGTDIGVGAVASAKEGVFGTRAMRLVSTEDKRRFFESCQSADTWRANSRLRRNIEFRCHNLLKKLDEDPFDLVILKNVLIYFDPPSKAIVMRHIREAVKPGGLLIAGTTDGVNNELTNWTKKRPWLFERPA